MYIKIYFFIIIPEYNKLEKQSGRVCVFQSLVLSFILGGIIVLTFALVDEKIYQEHRFPYIFLLSTFVLLFESLLVFLDMTLFSNIQLSDLNMLLWPVYLYPYYHYANRTNRLCSIFYSFFTYLAVEGTATFLTIIVSSVIGDAFVAAHSISKIVYLVIHNTTNEITFDIRKIYEEGYSTKGENRGLGLNNVRKILANYGTMFLETELQGNRFLQVLKIGGYEQE